MTHWGPLELVQLSNPNGLWLATLVVPLMLIALLRGRPARVVVSSLLLWRDLHTEQEARFQSELRRPPLTAWLQAASVLLISLAAADPGLSSPTLAPRAALVIDVSASMQTREPDGTPRLELAKARARDFVRHAPADAEVVLVAAGRAARVISPFGSDPAALSMRLDALEAEDCEGEVAAAIDLAREQLGRSLGEQRLVLFTDGALADPLARVPDSTFERTVRVGTPQVNVAIVQLEVSAGRRDDSNGDSFGVQVLTTVKNFGLQSRRAQLRLHQRNVEGVLASADVELEPGQEQFIRLGFDATPADQGTGLWVELTPGDALTVDDRAYAVVPPYAKQPVVLVAERPNPWLTRAFAADRGVELRVVAPNDLDLGALSPTALVVYSGFCPAELPPASFVVIDPKEGRCFDVEVGAPATDLRFTHWDEQDLRFRFAQLDDVQLTRAHALRPRSAADALAWSQGSVLIARTEVHDRHGTVLGFDIADTNWPLETSFVLFVRGLVELAKGPLGAPSRTTQTGQTLSIGTPSDVQSVSMREPFEDAVVLVPARDGRALLPQLTRAGFYHFSWQGNKPGSSLAAASLLSPRESDPAQRDVPVLGPLGYAGGSTPPTRIGLGPWLVALALALLGIDAVVSTRGRAPVGSHST